MLTCNDLSTSSRVVLVHGVDHTQWVIYIFSDKVVVVVYWRIHYIYCHSIDLTVIYNNSGYRWDAGSINI